MRLGGSGVHGVISNVWTGTTGSFASRLAQLVRARRGPVLWLTLCGTLLVIAIFVGTIMMVNEFRKRAIRNSERELQNTVTLLTRHFDQQFEDSETIAAELIAQMRVSGASTPEAFRQQMSTMDAHLMLHSRVNELSYIGDVAIFDTDGRLLNWSRPDSPTSASPSGAISRNSSPIRKPSRSRSRQRKALSAEIGPPSSPTA